MTSLGTAWQTWWQSRLPLTDRVRLTQRNVYILPTRAGWMLAATLALLLVASINYQLNLGYLLTFLLAGSGLVGMHVSHNTLRGLAMHLIAPNPCFSDSVAVFNVSLVNEGRNLRPSIGLRVVQTSESFLGAEQPHWVWADVAGHSRCTVQLSFTPKQRGLQRLPTLSAETRFPLGTFRVWTLWRPAFEMLVYPSPEVAPPPWPFAQADAGDVQASIPTHRHEAEDLDGLRAYRRGDALKHVVWKKAAKSGPDAPWVVRHAESSQNTAQLWLDFAQTGLTGTEQKLSRLCAWVLQAEKNGLLYGLRLPGQEIKPASGPAHQQICLQALALFA